MSAALELNQGLVSAALEIAERQAQDLRQLRLALERGDDAQALSLARKVCGLNETSNRTLESINRRTTVEKLAQVFSVFTGFDLLNREDKRRLLNTITPAITVANYEVKGMFIGLDKSLVAVDYDENERIWIPLAA